MLRLNASRTRTLVFTSVGHFVNDGSVFFVPFIVALLVALKGITALEVTVLLSLFYLSSTLASVVVGKMADRTGKPAALMALGIGFLGAGLIGFYLISVYTSGEVLFAFALLCDLVMGAGSSFYHPLGGSLIQTAFGRGAAGRALGVNGSMGSVGRALYPSLFYVAAAVFTTPGSLGFFGLVGLGAALLIWTGIGRSEAGRTQSGSEGPSVRGSLSRPMIMLLGVSFLRSAALFGITAYIPIFLSTQTSLGISSYLGLALTAFYASAIIGQPVFGLLTERLDHRLVLAITAVGAAVSIVAYVNSGGAGSIVLLSIFGFFTYTGFPLLMSLAADYAAQNASALGNSIVWGLGATGGNSVGPLIVYALILGDYGRLGFSFEVMAVMVAVSALGAMLIPRVKPGTSAKP